MSEQLHSRESLGDEQLAEQLGYVADEIANRVAERRPVDLSDYMTRYPHLADVLPTVFASVRGLSSWCEELPEGQDDDSQGMQLGDYRLERELGRGGMGIVYEAEQLSLRRQVAVKVFPFASVLEPNKLKRFKNEALAAATLEHPHIVPVYGVGVDRSTHFYAMRLISGSTLADAIHRFHSEDGSSADPLESRSLSKTAGTSDPREQEITTEARQSTILSRSSAERQQFQVQVASWIRDAAEALHYAHSLGVVHRDVKPTNLLIDEEQKIWVTDFGLATGVLDTHLTRTGDLLGTLAYMSPEQVSGERQILDHRADVYSLGVTLYEALTGQKPFTGGSQAELIRRVLSDDAKWPNDLHRAVSTDLRNIATKAISKDPGERYGSARAFANDLSRYLRGEAVQARPPSIWNRSSLWVKRNRVVTAAALTVFACLALATTITFVSAYRIKTSSDIVKRHLYVADLQLAAEAIEKDNIGLAQELLSRHLPTGGNDLRGFTWHFLWKKSHPAEYKLAGHGDEVQSVDWSPDGRQIVSVDRAGNMMLWDAASGKLARALPRWKESIVCVRYAPDGTFLALVDVDGRLALFDGQHGKLLREVQAHRECANSLHISPDSLTIATCSDDGTIRVWNSADLSQQCSMEAHGFGVYDVRFYAGGTHLASVGTDRSIWFWRLGEKQPVETITVGAHTRSLAMAPDERTIVCSVGLGELRQYDVSSYKELAQWTVSQERFYEVRYSPDGRYLVATGKDRLSRLIDSHTGDVVRTFVGHVRRVYGASFSPDGAKVVTSSADGTCSVFPTAPQATQTVERLENISRITAAFSPDGRMLAYDDRRGNFWLRDNDHGRTSLLPGTHFAGRFDFAFSADGDLATAGGPSLSWDSQQALSGREQSAPASIDLDLDGDHDLLAAVGPHVRLLFQERFGPDQWSLVRMLPLGNRREPQTLWRSTQGDGLDAVSTANADGTAKRYQLRGQHVSRSAIPLSQTQCDVQLWEDLDGDGTDEIIARIRGEEIWKLFQVVEGDARPLSELETPYFTPACLCTTDIDRDGDKDIVMALSAQGRILWYRQRSPLEFEEQGVLAESLVLPSLLIAEDVDADGTADLISVDNGNVVWLKSLAPGEFDKPKPYPHSLREMHSVRPLPANIAVWNTDDKQIRTTFPAISHNPTSVTLSSDGRSMASCGDDYVVRLRDVQTQEQRAIIRVGQRVNHLAFSPDNGMLAIATGDGCILWDVRSRSVLADLTGHESTVRRIVFSPSGKRLLTLSHDLSVGIWEAETGRLARTLFGFDGRPTCACFSIDGSTVAIGTQSGDISLWDVPTGQTLCGLARFEGQVVALSFRGDAQLLALIDNREGSAALEAFTTQ